MKLRWSCKGFQTFIETEWKNLIVPPCVCVCSFSAWAVLFVLARLLTLSLSVLTVGFGLAGSERQGLNLAEGSYNVLFVR